MGAKKQTIGYHYLATLMFGIGRGPFDELRMVKVGDEVAWDGHACTDGPNIINKPELFGGEKKEGGIQGVFKIFMGQEDQVLPGASSHIVAAKGPYMSGTLPDLKATLGGRVPEMRGRVIFWFDGLIASMNHYVKEWKFRVRRSQRGWYGGTAWYPQKATIYLKEGTIHAMNGAHIIYECCTNPIWGRGVPADMMDENSFIYAADTLCAESFGLCMVWYRQEDIDQFIQNVCNHLGATVYTDRQTGKIAIRLIRADYVVNDMPLFTPDSGLMSIDEDDSGSEDTAFNEVIVTGHDPITDTDIQMRAHNIAARQAQSTASSSSVKYPGLPTTDLCGRIAERDKNASGAGLKKFKVTLDRRGFLIYPGSVFRVQDLSRGIAEVVLRAGDIDDGNMIDGRIQITAIQDVFGLPETSFVAPTETAWVPADTEAVPPLAAEVFEPGYRDAYLKVGEAEANEIDPTESYIAAVAAKATIRSVNYDFEVRPDGGTEYTLAETAFFTGSAVLQDTITAVATSFTLISPTEIPTDVVGDSLRVGDEIMRVESYDTGTGLITVARGTADTWPTTHAAGTRVWFPDDDIAIDERVYLAGDDLSAYILTRTSTDVLEDAETVPYDLTVNGRIARPYPPADVKIDGVTIYTPNEANDPVVTWVERNRLTQADHLIGFFEPTVAHEAGTTYRIRLYSDDGLDTLLRTEDPITSPWNYSPAMQLADGSPTRVLAELVAVRDGIESWEPRRFRIYLQTGYGYGYGLNYGGA